MKIKQIEVNGKTYELSESKDTECCQYCAFANQKECPGQCSALMNEEYFDGFWIEK